MSDFYPPSVPPGTPVLPETFDTAFTGTSLDVPILLGVIAVLIASALIALYVGRTMEKK